MVKGAEYYLKLTQPLGRSKYEHAVMWPIHRDGLRGLRDEDIFGLQFIYKIVTRQPLS
ncbi:MAG: hypothetical protein WCB31_06890 [Nitrososphaeraceae archaeon]